MSAKTWPDIVDSAAVVLNGTMAGIFFIFSVTIMQALRRQSPATGAAVMQTINRVIQNPLFLLVFLGAALCAVAAAALALPAAHRSWWIAAGGIICFLGMFAVTVVFNVPLNNQLDSIDANSPAGQSFWQQFQAQWTAWNHVRSVSGLLGTTLLVIGLVRR